jgi:PAS domain S-box-containing protein
MKIWHIFCLASLTVLSVFLLAAGWEFVIEDNAETVRDHWESVFRSTYFAALALIVPLLMALKISARHKKAQDEFGRASHILKTTFDNMSRGIAVRDADFNLIAFNQRYVDLMDYPPDLIRLGMGFEEIAGFKAERGDYGDGDPEELVRECLAHRNLMKPDRKEITTARGLVLAKRRERLPDGGYVTTFTDITKRKRADAELAKQSSVLETTFDNMSQGIAVYDADLRLVAFNDKFCDFRGYPPGFVRLGNRFEDMARFQAERGDYGPGDPEEQVRKRADALRQGKRWYGERLHSDGRVIAVQRDPLPGGGSVSTFTDITERKRAEEAVRESEGRLAGILDIADEAVVSIDETHGIILFNKGAEKIFGYGAAEVLGEPLEMLLPDEFKKGHRAQVKNFAEGATVARKMAVRREIRGRRKDGTEFPGAASISRLDLDGKRVFTVIMRDITQRMRADEALAKLTRSIRLLHKIAVAANEATDADHALQATIDEVCAYSGWPVGHVYTLAADGSGELVPTDLWHLDDAERFNVFRQVTGEIRFAPGIGLPGRVLASGKPAWISDVTKDENFPRSKLAKDIGVRAGFAFPVLIGKEVVAVLEFFAEDTAEPDAKMLEVMAQLGTQLGRVIERMRAEEALRESEARFRAVVDNSPTKIHIKDAEGRYTLVNPLAEKLFGFTDEEARGKTSYDIFPKEVADAFTAHDRQVADSGEMAEQVEHFTVEDCLRTYLTVKFPIPDGHGGVAGIAAIGTDITERKQVEETLAKQSGLLETTFETMTQGISVYDADHRLVAFNQRFVDLFDFPAGFLRTGMSLEEIARFNAERGEYGPGDVEDRVRERVGAMDRGEINPRERTRPNGTIISARRDPMPDGGYVTTYTDITARKRAEEALRASEQRLRDIAESSSDWFWEMDAELRFTYFSERYAEITGFDPKERIATTRSQFSSESDLTGNAENWAAHMADLEARRPFRNFEYATTASGDGRSRHVRSSGIPIFDADGEFLGYRGVGTDITVQKKAEEALAEQSMLLETTFETISQGIVVYDKDLRIAAFNQKYIDLCAYPANFIRLGMPFEKISRFRAERGDYGPVDDLEEVVRDRTRARHEGKLDKRERADLDGIEVVVRRDPMPDGGYVTTFTDITDIKRAEVALRDSESRLKQHVIELEAAKHQYQAQGIRLADLAEDLAVARDQAEGSNRAKSEFLALMSHELRTPLNAIIGFSEIIKSEMMGPVGNPKYGEYASDVFDSGQHLLGLINDILDLSKIEAGRMEFDETDVDVAEVIASCLRLVTERAIKGGVRIETEIPDDLAALRIDERKLKQILLNLLSNAVKFTPSGGSVTVKTWLSPDSGFVLQVADTGVGIALEDIPKALTPFGQVDSRLDRKYEGTGLGLPLTKSLVEKHGGSLELQSEVGVGTTVTVRLPKERAVETPAGGPPTQQSLSTA